MYKRKLLYFGLVTSFILLLALVSTAISAQLNRENLKQSHIAYSLLVEHEKLSSTSYRLFKQLIDGVIFGKNANQAFVRNKQAIISQSLVAIRQLKAQQHEVHGLEFTHERVEDTGELERLINEIIAGFQEVVTKINDSPLNQQEDLRSLLEVKIDNQFREVINLAVTRQGRFVAAINARIDTLNTAVVWFSIGLGVLSFPIIIYGCYWLFNQLYQPIILIRSATNTIASGEYDKPISEKLDEEFEGLAMSINQLAARLIAHESNALESKKQLEVEVEQRNSELTKANLQLTKIDARRRQFIADVSHELRTPLTIIRGEAQVTLRMQSASQEDYTATLLSILEQSVNLSDLVDDLLFLTRAEMNQLELNIALVDINPLLQAEVNRWQRRCEDRTLSLVVTDDLKSLEVLIDKPRIQQVLSVLLDNAHKYSRAGGSIEVQLSLQQAFISIAIKDSGDGISAAEIENVFERFVRFSKNNEGLGLGLPIAKAIIDAHGGNISVVSNQGEGATFIITLPLAQSA